jgi:hypothetical protein
MVCDANGAKKELSCSYSPPVCLHRNYLTTGHSFYKALEFFKELKDLIFVTQEISSCKLNKIINEADIVLLITK